MPEDSILVADGGFAGHWGGLLYDTKRAGRHFIADRGFASIGYGVPGSLGAQLAAGARRVVGLTGDGGFNMALGEFETARRAGAAFVRLRVQQRGVGIREGAAALDVRRRQLSVVGSDRDGLRGDRARHGMPRHPRRATRKAGARPARRARQYVDADGARHRGHARSRRACCPASMPARSRCRRATGRCELGAGDAGWAKRREARVPTLCKPRGHGAQARAFAHPTA